MQTVKGGIENGSILVQNISLQYNKRDMYVQPKMLGDEVEKWITEMIRLVNQIL